MKINKTELVEKIVTDKENAVTKKDAAMYIDTVFDAIKDLMSDGHSVFINGFGTFEVVERPERQGRNPQTGESIVIAASKAPKFKAAKGLKDAVN